jgi:hypothetical protein
MQGFIIIEKSEYSFLNYQANWESKNVQWFFQLRKTFPNVDIKKYKGLGSTLIEPYSLLYNDNEEVGKIIQQLEKKYGYFASDGEFLYKNLNDCLKVLQVIPDKENYEVLEIRNETLERKDSPFLGYDIGNVGYSVIHDAILFPMWHPIDLDDIEAIKRLGRLNESGLFSSLEEAIEFLSFYNSRHWAEKGDFEIWMIKQL